MVFLPDELRLTVNNSKSFANKSKSIIRNNVGLCNRSKIQLIKTFKNIVMDLMVYIDFGRKDLSNKLMIFFKSEMSRGYDAGEEGDGSRRSFAR